jgi:hypothetical protein
MDEFTMIKKTFYDNNERRIKMGEEKYIGFTQGVVYSVAQLVRRGNLHLAKYLWKESGFESDDIKVCSEQDVKELRKFLSNAPKGTES